MEELDESSFNLIRTPNRQQSVDGLAYLCNSVVTNWLFKSVNVSDLLDLIGHETQYQQHNGQFEASYNASYFLNVGEGKDGVAIRIKLYAILADGVTRRSAEVAHFKFTLSFRVHQPTHGVEPGHYSVTCVDDVKSLKKLIPLLNRKQLPVAAMMKLVNGTTVK